MIRALWQKRHRLNVWETACRNEEAWMRCMDRQIEQDTVNKSMQVLVNAQCAVISNLHERVAAVEAQAHQRPVRRTTVTPMFYFKTKEDC